MKPPIQALNTARRKEASRRLAWQSVLLSLTVVLAVAVSGESRIEPTGDSAEITRLKAVNERQADQLDQWRQRFTYCKTAVAWQAAECGVKPSSPVGSSIPVRDRSTTIVRDSDDSDDDDNGTTVVVRPTVVPKDPPASDDPGTVEELTDPLEDTVDDVSEMLSGVTEAATQ